MVPFMSFASVKKKSILLTSNIVFYIVSEKRLQKELLASYLHNEIGNKCFVMENINNIQRNHKDLKFILWDCSKKNLDDMMVELNIYNTQRISNNHIALFNVPVNLKFPKDFVSKGIHGFFYEHDSLENLTKGIQVILSEKLWFPRALMSNYIIEGSKNNKHPAKSTVEILSQRQIEILSLISIGATNQEIAEKLYISSNTVKNHVYNIFKKINVSNRIQASLWATTNL
jgi:DNA-binding NarL/FixJ family response regulator